MVSTDNLLNRLTDPRLAALVARRGAAFAVGANGRLVLTNAAGLAALGEATLADVLDAPLPPTSPLFREAGRLARSLPPGGEGRLERLRLPGEFAFAPATTACRRATFADLGEVVLIASIDHGGDRPAPRADVARLIAGGLDTPALVCAPDGTVLARTGVLPDALDTVATIAEIAAGFAEIATTIAEVPTTIDGLGLALTRLCLGTPPLLIARPVACAIAAPAETAAPTQPDAPDATLVQDAPIAPVELPIEAPPEQPEAPAPAVADTPPAARPSVAAEAPALRAPRRLPMRFVWQTDEEGHLAQISPELMDAVGPRAADVIGEKLVHLAERLGFDPDGRIARAMTKRDTWSGVGVNWPTDDGTEALIDLAGLPVFDRDRAFRGYRGFGVCRAVQPRAAAPLPPPAATTAAPADDGAAREEPLARPEPPALATPPANVVALRPAGGDARRITLSTGERNAFREIGRALGAEPIGEAATREAPPAEPAPTATTTPGLPSAFAAPETLRAVANGERAVLDRLPNAVLVHRGETILYANRALLDWTGHADADALARSGGVAALFDATPLDDGGSDGKPLTVRGAGGVMLPVEARLFTAPWEGESALVLMMRRLETTPDERLRALEQALRAAEGAAREQQAILDTATDGVILTDREGRILGTNKAAEALFGYDAHELAGRGFAMLFAAESHRAALDYLDGLVRGGVASVLNDGREVIGRVREGGLIALFMTMGRLDEEGNKFCAVFRDISQWKKTEEELVAARRAAERASSHKSDFLAKISHEIRTPLNAIIGFSEVMMEERFGPVGNPRYKEYLQDIHISGTHVVSLVNDLLDLSKIEAGRLDLTFTSVDLNDILTQSMAIMQPQASRQRIIIRTSLAPNLPPVVADARSMRQIALNLLSNSIKFTQAGGQVILSTALSENGEVLMRVRDTGVGMSDADVAAALEPFRQITTSGRATGEGTGLGLPLTKALVEANRASFAIKSALNSGTMVEVTFPATRVLAE